MNLYELTLPEMVEGLRAGQFSSQELVGAHIDRIEQVNPKVNAFVATFFDAARDAARKPIPGPLSGIPLTVKDSFDIAGGATAVGSRLRRDAIAQVDSVPVERLRRAGAILMGRTNTPEFLYNYETDNFITGRTNNPWNLDRTPGGSSGGESAAIASLCSPGGVGSDGGGSVRWPAHCCGLAGLKPTPGRIPAAGHWPEIGHPGGFMGVAGPMSRTATGVRLLWSVLSGYDPRDPFSAPVGAQPADSRKVHIVVMEQFQAVPVQAAMRHAVQMAATLLSDLGHGVGMFDTSCIATAPNLWLFLFGELPAALMAPMLEPAIEQCHPLGLEFYSNYRGKPGPDAARIHEVFAERDRMRAEVIRLLEPNRVILAPAAGITAFPHGQRRFQTLGKDIGLFEAMMPLTPWNLLGFPSVTVPITVDVDGMPAGIQLIGRHYEDELLMDLAIRLEDARGPFTGIRDRLN